MHNCHAIYIHAVISGKIQSEYPLTLINLFFLTLRM